MKTIEAITQFATTKSNKGCITASGNNQIRPADFSGLGRVWNDGRGFLQLADFHKNGTLVINTLLLKKSEVKELKETLKVPFAMVEYGYPDYYNESLTYQLDKKNIRESFQS